MAKDKSSTAYDIVAIYQEYLDFMAKALLARDADRFFSRLYFPHVIITEDATQITHSREELEPLFQSVSNNLIEQRVTDYARIVMSAERESAETIVGHWETHVLQGGHRLVAPYPSCGRLRLVDGVWLSSHVVQGFRYPQLPNRFPLVSDAPQLRDLDTAEQMAERLTNASSTRGQAGTGSTMSSGQDPTHG